MRGFFLLMGIVLVIVGFYLIANSNRLGPLLGVLGAGMLTASGG